MSSYTIPVSNFMCSGRGKDEEIKSQTHNHLSQVREMFVLSVRVNMKKSNLRHAHLSHKKFSTRELVTQVGEFTMEFTTMSSTITKGC